MKKLNDKDRDIFKINLESLDFQTYEAIRGEFKSGRYKNCKTIFENLIWKAKKLRKLFYDQT